MTDALPILVAEFRKNRREVVRIVLDEYGGRPTLNLRVWFTEEGGEVKPGRPGITIAVTHLPAIASGLNQALERAISLGLIDRPASGKVQ